MTRAPTPEPNLAGAPSPRRLVIIGGGFSGAALALEVARASAGAIRVQVIDRLGGFGPGLAYSTSDPAHLLNVHAERMSALPNAPDDFLNWLRDREGSQPARDGFAPRQLYGEYLAARMSIAREFAESGALVMTRGDAIACRVENDKAVVALADGDVIEADAVVFALGNPPTASAPDFAALTSDQYKPDPWEAAAIAAIPSEQTVLLIGTGLTMIDMVMSLTPRAGKIIALSRRGLTPRPHPKHGAHGALERLDPPLALSAALHFIRREAREMEARGEPWQRLMDRLRPDIQKFWRRLPLGSQQRFLRHARPYWDVHRHRAPPHAHEHLTALQASGQLRILAGKLVSAAPEDGDARVTYRPRGKRESETIDVGCIINCTGPDADRTRDPLVQVMIESGLARAHPTGIGLDVSEDGRLLGADGAPAARLFAIGPPTQGAYWESTAVPEIRKRAAELAQALVAT